MFKGTKQSGFAVIETILVIVILAIAGGTGYYVYQANNKTTDTYDAAGESASGIVKADKKTNSNDKEQSYLVIKEWNVKLPLTDAISTANYRLEDGYVYLGVTGAGDACSASVGSGSIGAVSRFTKSEVNPETKKTYLSMYDAQSEFYPAQVGNYYYSFQGSHAACSDDNAQQAKADAAREAFVQQIKKIEAN